MYSLETGDYSEKEVLKALRTHRTVSYRYELLDKNDRPIGDVTASGSVSFDSGSAIKRVARLSIKEEKEVDYLSDRNLAVTYDILVPVIENPDKTGPCIMDQTVADIEDPSEAFVALKNIMTFLKKHN